MHYLAYDEKSNFNDTAIIAIRTENSGNKKTGNIPQTYFLLKHTKPQQAIKEKKSNAICGLCPLIAICYVLAFQGPTQIWKSFKAGKFSLKKPNKVKVQRIGAYGDAGSIPDETLQEIEKLADVNLNYTHSAEKAPWLKGRAMASVESESKASYYQKKGWKTFRIKEEHESKMDNEVVCPFETKQIQCMDCKLCTGNKVNVVVTLHGSKVKQNKFIALKEYLEKV